jgi:hypothetical protein
MAPVASPIAQKGFFSRVPEPKSTEQSLTPSAVDCTLLAMQLLEDQSEEPPCESPILSYLYLQ